MASRGKNGDLVSRLAARFEPLRRDSPHLYEAFTRIGMLVSAKAKMNVRRYGMIDTGRLVNSLRYQIHKTDSGLGVKIGSFGVPYAAIHEFGGPFTEQMRRAMFAELARRGRRGQGKNKGVIRDNYIRKRPYLRPAVNSSRPFMVSILRKVLGV
jgi:phage gpG-like protein